jgi:hypothetical protein
MDRVTIGRIFDPFSTTKTDTGTGLGTWVVAQSVERNHGRVRAWSTQRPGRGGPAFSVFLPFNKHPQMSNRRNLPSRRKPEFKSRLHWHGQRIDVPEDRSSSIALKPRLFSLPANSFLDPESSNLLDFKQPAA